MLEVTIEYLSVITKLLIALLEYFKFEQKLISNTNVGDKFKYCLVMGNLESTNIRRESITDAHYFTDSNGCLLSLQLSGRTPFCSVVSTIKVLSWVVSVPFIYHTSK